MPGIVMQAFGKQDFMAPNGTTSGSIAYFLAAKAKDISQWREVTFNLRGHKGGANTMTITVLVLPESPSAEDPGQDFVTALPPAATGALANFTITLPAAFGAENNLWSIPLFTTIGSTTVPVSSNLGTAIRIYIGIGVVTGTPVTLSGELSLKS